jgi:hypothetical protein
MKPEGTIRYKEMQIPPVELGQKFLERWFVPELWGTETKNPVFQENVGKSLRFIGENFPDTDPDWELPSWKDRLSMLDLYDLAWKGGREKVFGNLWNMIHKTLNKDVLYFHKGSTVGLREYDFLVTTPLSQAKAHVKEAEDAIKYFEKTGKIDRYWRTLWPFPKNLRIGSKMFYVDNRAIRGFSVVTDIDINEVTVNMDVNTWRWISPIACDYGKIKPPQNYSRAIGHTYFEGIDKVKIIGEWLEPMPQKFRSA